MARYLHERKLSLKEFKDTISDEDDKTIRKFLSGDLRLKLLDEMKTALDSDAQIFAALFELSDAELVEALCALGNRAHLVLANGSITKKKEKKPLKKLAGAMKMNKPAGSWKPPAWTWR